MKKTRFLAIVTFLVLSLMLAIPNNVFAWQTAGTNTGAGNLIWLPWHPGTPNLYWRFYFSDTGQTVYCIEPHVTFNGGHAYSYLGKYSNIGGDSNRGRAMSYVYSAWLDGLNDEETRQVKQTVIWALNGDFDIYGLDRGNGYVNRAIALFEEAINYHSPDIWNLMSTHDLSFHLEGNNWVSNWVWIKPGSSVWNNVGGLQRDGDNWRLVVDNGSISGWTDAYIYSSMTGTFYDECDVFDGANNASSNGQTVCIGGSSNQQTNNENAHGGIAPVGTLVVEKKDVYGSYRQGATFSISGPGGNWSLTTGNDGKITLNNIATGTYTITETQATDGMTNPEDGRSVQVNVNAGQVTTYTRTDTYPRGSVSITKFDRDHRGATLGDATIAGAKFALYAAQDIYEGYTKIYSADQCIAENITTKADGSTDAVGNLPAGRYYYKETQAPTGFNLNTDPVYVNVSYQGQYGFSLGNSAVEMGDAPIYGTIKIIKKLQASDYDAQINLKGAKFRATLKSNPNQYYDSNVSGADGVCQINNIPYGTYIVEEIQVPDSAYKMENFEVFVSQNGQVYEYTKEDGSKQMILGITKDMLLEQGEATDAVVEGAQFTVYRDSQCTDKVCDIATDARGNAQTKKMWTGKYYVKETKFPTGVDPNQKMKNENVTYKDKVYVMEYDNKTQGAETPTVTATIENEPNRGSIKITKSLEATDLDDKIYLEGAQFRATLNSDPSSYFDSNISGINGVCEIIDIPYGTYTVEEIVVPDSALKIDNFEVFVQEDGKVYTFDKEDKSKKMEIEVYKHMVVNEGEATDAVVEGAIFTVYRDAEAKIPYVDKNGKVVTIGPTDANGYAKSQKMRTGTYYIKETTFPRGVDPDAIVTGENVTYRNKVYTTSINNASQTEELAVFTQDVDNKPNRNDIEIIKKVGETSNTPKFPLDQCEFTVTLKSTIGTDHVFSRKCSAETTRDTGYCIIEDLPYGEYVVEETKVSPISLKCSNFDIFVSEDRKVKTVAYQPKDSTNWYDNNPLDSDNAIVDIPKVMYLKMRKVDHDRTDVNPVDYVQGDAVLKGAIYQIYRYDPMTDAYTEYVYDITVDHQDSEGYWCAESRDLLVGNYMIKEKVKSTEIVNGKEVKYSYATGYLVDEKEYYFIQNPAEQTGRTSYHTDVSDEVVIRGQVRVIKYDNILGTTDNVASEGAILRLTLNSNPDIWYETTIRNDGSAEFVDTNDSEHTTAVKTNYGYVYFPDTIPYGRYTISEMKESNNSKHTSFFIQPEQVFVETQEQVEYRIESDNPIELYLKIQKRDKDTNATVALAGAKFKVWDVAKSEFVTQKTYPDGKYIDEYTTNENGYLYLPDKIQAGDYIIYETQAPEGYYLEDDLRLPKNESDIGKEGKGGTYVVINKGALKVVDNIPSSDIELEYTVNQLDTPLKGRIEIFKEGEMLVDSSSKPSEFGDVYTAKYEKKGLEGVTYKIYAATDILSPDGKQTYVTKDTLVDTITTNSEGLAKTKDLYLGEYRIEETKAPAGFIIDTEIDNVTLTNKDQYVKVQPLSVKLGDDRQKLQLTINKTFTENKYSDSKSNDKTATFKVCAAEDIKNYAGQTVIAKDSIVYLLEYKNGTLNYDAMDLPQATYYVQEVACSVPYSLSEKVLGIKLDSTTSQKPVEIYNAGTIDNDFDSANLVMFKVTSAIMDKVVLNGANLDDTELDAKLNELISELKSMTDEEFAQYAEETKNLISGAKYQVYVDEKCEKPLYKENDEGVMEEVYVESDDQGKMMLTELPLRTYYLKEITGPQGYEVSKEPIKVTLSAADKNVAVFVALADDNITKPFIRKTDIFTGDVVPNCTFEITDADDEVIYYGITDSEGIAYIPVSMFENGETYYFTEIEAPDMYNLNTDKHEFVAEYEYVEDESGNTNLVWTADLIEVENIRKTQTVTLIKTDVMETKLIPNCKFVLQSLENKDWKVEGVTDENGEYVFENVPYGKYTYTELEAPEEYNIDTTPHEFEVGDKPVVLYVTNELNTGDIAVFALAGIALVSVLGIAFVMLRKKVRA